MPRKAGASSKGKGRRKGSKRGREEGEDSPRGPTPPPEDLPPADGADQDLPPTEEERPQEEEDQPPEVVEEADDAADGEATPSPGSKGSKAKKARILSNLNDEEQEEVTVIFICDIPLLIITLIYRHFAIIWYGVQGFDFVYNYIIIILGGPLSRTTRLHLQ